MSPSEVSVCHCWANQLPLPLGMPSMSGIWPVSACTPTPVRNPMSTDAERKSPMNARRSSRATSSSSPVIRAIAPQ